MMEAKDKAYQLYEKFFCITPEDLTNEECVQFAKKCALILVNEVMENNPHKIVEKFYVDSGGNKTDNNYFEMVSNQLYWYSVKKEIELL